MSELKQALRQAVEALSGMLEVHGVRQSDLRGGADVPSAWVELSDYARSAVAAVEAALAQPEPEPVAWQHRRPLCGSDGGLIGYSGWDDGRGLEHWPTRALYADPMQSAELAAVTAERDRLHASLDRWVIAAAPGGWVHELTAERDQLRAALTEECILTECESPEGDPRDVLKRLTTWHAEMGGGAGADERRRAASAAGGGGWKARRLTAWC